MNDTIPAKRRRGGQPGNHNAQGNRGNRRPRCNQGNRGGGAPLGNQNASKKRPAPHMALLQEFEHDSEAAAWIKANAALIDEAGFKDDDERDRALYDGFSGLTPDALAESGREYKLGLYTVMIADEGDREDQAA